MNLFNWFSRLYNARKTARPVPRYGNSSQLALAELIGPEVAMAYWAVMACIKQIASPISTLDWYEYQKKSSTANKSGDALNSPLTRLLNLRPNPEMTAKTFRETMLLSALLHRGAYAEIERNMRGEPIALWPLAPWSVEPKRLQGGQLIYEVKTSNHLEPEKPHTVVLQEQDVFKIIGLSWDGINPMPTYGLAGATIGLGLAADQFAQSFFKHGIVPTGIITNPARLDSEVVDVLLAEFKSRYQGTANTGEPLYLDNGLDYKPMSPKFVDAELNQSRIQTALQICGFFGVPPYKLGLEMGAGYGATATVSKEFEKTTILSWVVAFEQEADVKLISPFRRDRFTKLSMESLLRGSINERYEAYGQGMQFGFLTPNRIAEMEGMPPYDDGDMRLTLTNMTTTEGIQAITDRIKAEIARIVQETKNLAEKPEPEQVGQTAEVGEDDKKDDPEDTSTSNVSVNLQLGGFNFKVENVQPKLDVNMPALEIPDIVINHTSPGFNVTPPNVNIEVINHPTHDVRILQDNYVSAPIIELKVDPPITEPPQVSVNVEPPLVVVEPNITMPPVQAAEVYIVQPNIEIEGVTDDELQR